MKIAIYQPRLSYYIGGGEVVPAQQALFLSAAGHDVTIITTRAPFINESELFAKLKAAPSIRIAYINVPQELAWIYEMAPGQNWRRWDLESLHIGILAQSLLVGKNYDIVSSHNLFDAIAVPKTLRSVIHLHGYPNTFDYHHKLLMTLPDALVAVSQQIASRWQTIVPSGTNILVSENGIDSNHFAPTQAEERYDLLYIGRLLPVKGVDTLLEALSILPKGITLAIAGNGPYSDELKQLAHKHGLSEFVKFLGYVPDDKMVDLYNCASIVALPSRDKEGILTTLLEAAACGRPVVSTTAGSMSEFVVSGKNGLLVEPGDANALAKAIGRLMSDNSLRQELGKVARADILESWTWQNKITKLESIYKQIINTRRS